MSTNPSFSGLLSKVKPNARGIFEGPDQWAQIKDNVKVEDAKNFLIHPSTWLGNNNSSSSYPPPKPGHVRICCISDTHNQHELIEKLLPPHADILIHAGDFSSTGQDYEVENFCNWLKSPSITERFKKIALIAGNHECSLSADNYEQNWRRMGHRQKYDTTALRKMLKSSCSNYLENESAEILGLKFYGSPLSPWFYDWGFQLSRDNGESHKAWSEIPTDTDILITHGPAMGHGDVCVPENKHFGDADLLDWIEAFKPLVAVSGHLHEGYGATTNGHTVFLNASSLNERYDAGNPNMPLVMDVPVFSSSPDVEASSSKKGEDEKFA